MRFAHAAEIVADGSRPIDSCLVLRGFAARSQLLTAGSRQITALHVAGDFVDLHSMLLKTMDHSVVAQRPCDVGFIPHAAITSATRNNYNLTRLLWFSTVCDAAVQRSWITSLGRRSPAKKLAHLVCELYTRLEAAGAASDERFDFPITQIELADVLGRSSVHVNRTLQAVRATGLLRWEQQRVTILDFARLATYAEFDPSYLSLRPEQR